MQEDVLPEQQPPAPPEDNPLCVSHAERKEQRGNNLRRPLFEPGVAEPTQLEVNYIFINSLPILNALSSTYIFLYF